MISASHKLVASLLEDGFDEEDDGFEQSPEFAKALDAVRIAKLLEIPKFSKPGYPISASAEKVVYQYVLDYLLDNEARECKSSLRRYTHRIKKMVKPYEEVGLIAGCKHLEQAGLARHLAGEGMDSVYAPVKWSYAIGKAACEVIYSV